MPESTVDDVINNDLVSNDLVSNDLVSNDLVSNDLVNNTIGNELIINVVTKPLGIEELISVTDGVFSQFNPYIFYSLTFMLAMAVLIGVKRLFVDGNG